MSEHYVYMECNHLHCSILTRFGILNAGYFWTIASTDAGVLSR